MRLEPTNALAYSNIGNIYLNSGNYIMAIKAYRKALKLDSNVAGAAVALEILGSDDV